MHHKMLVMSGCFKVGLYRQGLLHDMSKFSPSEFLVGCKYYQGTRSPNNAERETIGYSSAWLHHKGRNKHHFEYWMDYSTDGSEGLVGMEMPLRYVAEMFMDRVAASKTYMRDTYRDTSPLEYYEQGKAAGMIHPHTREILERYLKTLAQKGEEETFAMVRRELKEERKHRRTVG